jgi:hypothetical protein
MVLHMAEPITDEELFDELRQRKAIIVHCSRTGKGDETPDSPLFPEDLKHAINACADGENLCCSVIWPDHIETFGPVGIVLRPRCNRSVTAICFEDAGSYVDSTTGKREGFGDAISKTSVQATFTNATGYNEWDVMGAETIGIFVHPHGSWEIASKMKVSEIPGYDPSLADGEIIGTREVTLPEIIQAFPSLPIYSFANGDLVEIKWSGNKIICINKTMDQLYE